MPKTLYLATNGPELKNITLPQYPDSAWDWISGAPETKNDDLYARVAAVYRVANMSAEAVANMPFALVTEGGVDYDVIDACLHERHGNRSKPMARDNDKKFILWFNEIGLGDVPLVGGKNASLGEMYQKLEGKGIRVPVGTGQSSFLRASAPLR